jgi:ABC-type transport system substrate-binding protein
MHQSFAAGVAILLSIGMPVAAAETPKRGGTLTYMIPADAPPSFDGHREGTFATVHAVAPFYSVLVRVNPENPASTTDFVCDVCTEIPEPADGGRAYAFPIREDVRFQDGSVLTAYDVAASWNKIVDPPEGVISARGETDFARQRQLMRQFEKLVLDTETHEIFLLWRYRIVPYRSYVKGWKVSPSHYVNQDLATIWLDK